MKQLERYRRALRRALNAAEAELGYLQSTSDELLSASPERVLELGAGASRLALRLERRGRVLRGRAQALAGVIDADGPEVGQLTAQLEPAASAELQLIVRELRTSGGALGDARQKFRDSLHMGHTVARSMLRSIAGDAPVPRRASGLATTSRLGVLNREA